MREEGRNTTTSTTAESLQAGAGVREDADRDARQDRPQGEEKAGREAQQSHGGGMGRDRRGEDRHPRSRALVRRYGGRVREG